MDSVSCRNSYTKFHSFRPSPVGLSSFRASALSLAIPRVQLIDIELLAFALLLLDECHVH